jgi:hypothetical protein
LGEQHTNNLHIKAHNTSFKRQNYDRIKSIHSSSSSIIIIIIINQSINGTTVPRSSLHPSDPINAGRKKRSSSPERHAMFQSTTTEHPSCPADLRDRFDALFLDQVDGDSERCKDREADGDSNACLHWNVEPLVSVNTFLSED